MSRELPIGTRQRLPAAREDVVKAVLVEFENAFVADGVEDIPLLVGPPGRVRLTCFIQNKERAVQLMYDTLPNLQLVEQ